MTEQDKQYAHLINNKYDEYVKKGLEKGSEQFNRIFSLLTDEEERDFAAWKFNCKMLETSVKIGSNVVTSGASVWGVHETLRYFYFSRTIEFIIDNYSAIMELCTNSDDHEIELQYFIEDSLALNEERFMKFLKVIPVSIFNVMNLSMKNFFIHTDYIKYDDRLDPMQKIATPFFAVQDCEQTRKLEVNLDAHRARASLGFVLKLLLDMGLFHIYHSNFSSNLSKAIIENRETIEKFFECYEADTDEEALRGKLEKFLKKVNFFSWQLDALAFFLHSIL